MKAHIEGFVTRADAGLAGPRSVSRNFDPSTGGSAIHYGGPAQKIRSHSDCIKRWKQWQSYHMGKGWSDIAYTGGFCQHGYAFAGRGFGVRTAANGTNNANFSYYAFCWLGGEGEAPTDKAVAAAAWWVREARLHGRAGNAVRDHSSFKSTACCGDPLRARLSDISQAASVVDVPKPPVDVPTPPQEDDEVLQQNDKAPSVRFWKHRLKLAIENRRQQLGGDDPTLEGLNYKVDDNFDGGTKAAVNRYKKSHGLAEDGVIDATTMQAIAEHL